MRCAFVSSEVAGFHLGGIGTYVAEAGRALSAAGHEVWLIVAPPAFGDREQLRRLPGFARVLLADEVADTGVAARFALAPGPLDFAQRAYALLRGAQVPFDYIEFADYGASGAVAVPEQRLFGSLGAAVVTVVLHSPTYDCWHENRQDHVYGPELRETAAIEHEVIRLAPLVWSPSQRLREIVCQRLSLDPARIPLVRYPMALPPTSPTPPPARQKLSDLHFLFLGRIEPRKGVRELVAAFRELPELSIDCIGRDGPSAPLQTSEVQYLQRQGAPNVRFLPSMPREQLLQRLHSADVVILPSPWDNWPNACLEAMAAARVVIGGRNGGMGEMIEPGRSGFLCHGGDAADLVRVIREELSANLARLPVIGTAAAVRARELCAPAIYVAAIERLVAEHRGRGQLPAAPRQRELVSIVVPYYREDRSLLAEAVASASAQTHRDLEILLVNDGSPRPDAQDILSSVAATDPRIRWLQKSNGGLATARNHAIERAAGDFILFLDADNVLRPEYAATALDVFARCPDAMAVMPRFQVFDGATRRPLAVVQPLPYDRALALFRNSLGDAGGMFRRAVFQQHGLRYDPVVDCYSDWALWLDMAGRGLQVERIPRVLYDYRIRPDSMMAEVAMDRHLALLGLLVERHLPAGSAGDERALLTTLIQGWGVGALVAALGQDSQQWRDPVGTARRLQPLDLRQARLRDRLAHSLGKLADRNPRLRKLAHLVVGNALAWHGRWKDRRAARKAGK